MEICRTVARRGRPDYIVDDDLLLMLAIPIPEKEGRHESRRRRLHQSSRSRRIGCRRRREDTRHRSPRCTSLGDPPAAWTTGLPDANGRNGGGEIRA